MHLLLRWLSVLEAALSHLLGRRVAAGACEFLVFGLKELAACVFAGSFLLLLALSNHLTIPGVARYDLLFLGAIAIQIVLILCRLETWREVAVLSLFHLIGMGLELFKTAPGIRSWSYPEASFFHIATVPLYSGFMYAAVASYIQLYDAGLMMQAWRLFDLRVTGFPAVRWAVGLAAAIYLNFFTNHWLPDLRWPLAALVLLLFRRTHVHFTVTRAERRMPLTLSFLLIGFFIWMAENIATFFGAWVYPQQLHRWAIVGPNKISSWTLLVMISFIIVAALKQAFPRQRPNRAAVPADAPPTPVLSPSD